MFLKESDGGATGGTGGFCPLSPKSWQKLSKKSGKKLVGHIF